MNATQLTGIMQRWQIIQHELMPELRSEVGEGGAYIIGSTSNFLFKWTL